VRPRVCFRRPVAPRDAACSFCPHRIYSRIDLFRYITDAPAPMTLVARIQENALLSGDLARMTREQWRTKSRRRPRRGAESLRSSHAVDSVGIERRVSPAPCRGAMLTFRPSLPDRMTQEMGKRPNGAAAAILAVRPARTPRHDYTKGFRALAWPPSTLRTPLFARHSRQIIIVNNVFSDSGDRSRWRRARNLTVISVPELLDQYIFG
jgi:hypothetical protein